MRTNYIQWGKKKKSENIFPSKKQDIAQEKNECMRNWLDSKKQANLKNSFQILINSMTLYNQYKNHTDVNSILYFSLK